MEDKTPLHRDIIASIPSILLALVKAAGLLIAFGAACLVVGLLANAIGWGWVFGAEVLIIVGLIVAVSVKQRREDRQHRAMMAKFEQENQRRQAEHGQWMADRRGEPFEHAGVTYQPSAEWIERHRVRGL